MVAGMDVRTVLARDSARVALVVNANARRGRDALDSCRRVLLDGGVRHVEAHGVTSGDELVSTLDRVVATGPDLLIVGGGDGTVCCGAAHVAETDTVLGVLALGTANDFARTLELPQDPSAAVRALLEGKVVDIDLGRANGQAFLNVASMGLSVGVTERLTPSLKRRLGPVAYPVATLRAYRQHRSFTARLVFPEGDHPPMELDDLLQVAVGNGRHYGGGNTVSPTASVDDDLLDVYAIERGRLIDHVSIARLLKDGTFIEHDRVHHLTTRAVHISAGTPMPVNLDGEIAASTPTLFTLDRNALHVAVPARSRAARLDRPRP